jgi:hypothetical protein
MFIGISGSHPIEVDDQLKVGKLMPGNYAKLMPKRKHFDCQILFKSKVHDLPAATFMKKPLKEIPASLKQDYTYDGRIVINSWYIESNFPTNRTSSKLYIQCDTKIRMHIFQIK